MKHFVTIAFLSLILSACAQTEPQKHLFFFHSRYLENNPLSSLHPTHGQVEYHEILAAFETAGFEVHSEIRGENVNARSYAQNQVPKIENLIKSGVSPEDITIVGTSKGGYIAQYISTFLPQYNINYVFVASFREQDITTDPDIVWSGRVLNIYERSDEYGTSARKKYELLKTSISAFEDYELDTGLGHGFLFKANTGWMEPVIAWGKNERLD